MYGRNLRLVTIAGVAALNLLGASTVAGVTIWAGGYDVGASTPHPAPVESVLSNAMERSVQRHARDVQVPDGISPRDGAHGDQGHDR